MIEKVFEKCLWFIYCRSVIEILSIAFVLTFILLLIMIIMERKSNYHVYKNWQVFLIIILIIYVFILLNITLGSRESSYGKEYCLIPFYSYYVYLHGATEKLRESMMNILLFYPLGLLVGALFKKKKFILMGLLFSAGIEVCQYIFHLGYAEVDDVIHNTIGMAIGVILISSARKIIRYNNQKRSQKNNIK